MKMSNKINTVKCFVFACTALVGGVATAAQLGPAAAWQEAEVATARAALGKSADYLWPFDESQDLPLQKDPIFQKIDPPRRKTHIELFADQEAEIAWGIRNKTTYKDFFADLAVAAKNAPPPPLELPFLEKWKFQQITAFPNNRHRLLRLFPNQLVKTLVTDPGNVGVAVSQIVRLSNPGQNNGEEAVIVLVPGTFAGESRSYDDLNSVLYQSVLKFAKDYATSHNFSGISVISFRWTGANADVDRVQAGYSLNRFVLDPLLTKSSDNPDGFHVVTIAHSHGCNAINVATQFLRNLQPVDPSDTKEAAVKAFLANREQPNSLLASPNFRPIELMIQLSSPIMEDFPAEQNKHIYSIYTPAAFKRLVQFYGTADLVQMAANIKATALPFHSREKRYAEMIERWHDSASTTIAGWGAQKIMGGLATLGAVAQPVWSGLKQFVPPIMQTGLETAGYIPQAIYAAHYSSARRKYDTETGQHEKTLRKPGLIYNVRVLVDSSEMAHSNYIPMVLWNLNDKILEQFLNPNKVFACYNDFDLNIATINPATEAIVADDTVMMMLRNPQVAPFEKEGEEIVLVSEEYSCSKHNVAILEEWGVLPQDLGQAKVKHEEMILHYQKTYAGVDPQKGGKWTRFAEAAKQEAAGTWFEDQAYKNWIGVKTGELVPTPSQEAAAIESPLFGWVRNGQWEKVQTFINTNKTDPNWLEDQFLTPNNPDYVTILYEVVRARLKLQDTSDNIAKFTQGLQPLLLLMLRLEQGLAVVGKIKTKSPNALRQEVSGETDNIANIVKDKAGSWIKSHWWSQGNAGTDTRLQKDNSEFNAIKSTFIKTLTQDKSLENPAWAKRAIVNTGGGWEELKIEFGNLTEQDQSIQADPNLYLAVQQQFITWLNHIQTWKQFFSTPFQLNRSELPKPAFLPPAPSSQSEPLPLPWEQLAPFAAISSLHLPPPPSQAEQN